MLPYFEQPHLELGPLNLYAFGAMVALGFLAGAELLKWRARHTGLNVEFANRLVGWLFIGGLLGAHLLDRLVYNLPETVEDPWSLVRVWDGLSSYGAFLGGIVAAAIRLRGLPPVMRWRYVDAIAYAIPVGWLLGRIGCFLAYDHVGVRTDAWIGQRYADGVVRHNLGLEEAIFWAVAVPLFAWLGRRPLPPGMLAGLLCVLYAPVRFGLDFLRVGDTRFGPFIVSQYASMALFILGLLIVWRATRHHRGTEQRVSLPHAVPGGA